jgi:hypothetical protein
MSDRCELCGRAMLHSIITPTWWQHDDVCDRRRCQEARDDALRAVCADREGSNLTLVRAIEDRRERCQAVPLGIRHDTIARFDSEDRNLHIVEMAKRGGRR